MHQLSIMQKLTMHLSAQNGPFPGLEGSRLGKPPGAVSWRSSFIVLAACSLAAALSGLLAVTGSAGSSTRGCVIPDKVVSGGRRGPGTGRTAWPVSSLLPRCLGRAQSQSSMCRSARASAESTVPSVCVLRPSVVSGSVLVELT